MELDKFEVLRVLGEGSYGIVYKCMNRKTNQLVAIKKMKHSNDYDSQKIFNRELKMLRDIKHKHIVTLLEATKKRNVIYLVFEFIGSNLLEELKRYANGMDEKLVSIYLDQILMAVRYLHSNSIIHRDLKPANILIERNTLKVCDFGFARKIDFNYKHTEYVATRGYRAPELLLGMVYNEMVDVFAIGCIAFEMKQGRTLLQGNSDLSQLILITKLIGPLSSIQKQVFANNPCFYGIKFPYKISLPMYHKLPITLVFKEFLDDSLAVDPKDRKSAESLLGSHYIRGFRRHAIRKTKRTYPETEKAFIHNQPLSFK